MVALVELEDTKQRLRIDTDDDDAVLTGYIEAASAAVINYLKDQADELLVLGGSPSPAVEVPAEIVTATILLVGYFYDQDKDFSKEFELGYLPKPVMALLYPLRDPALA